MIATLHGTLVEKQPTAVILEVGGIGYEVAIPLSTYDRLPASGSPCRLLVYHLVRDDDERLFGFATPEEKRTFLLLMTISGIGPKMALSVLSGLTVAELRAAIAEGNAKRISAVHGIGRKTAERIVVELRDKVDPAEALAAAAGTPTDAARLRDAVLALAALGYAQDQARKMVQAALDAGADPTQTEALVRRALSGR
jgi:Holliday junction DNA helicase RuvA